MHISSLCLVQQSNMNAGIEIGFSNIVLISEFNDKGFVLTLGI
jgi:hypothetical protein